MLPGPSAVETALVASGLGAAQYRFLGYLPRREAELARCGRRSRGWDHAVVAFESPQSPAARARRRSRASTPSAVSPCAAS